MSITMKPEFITFTGVDGTTDPAGLVQLADDYPIEWGLLFSPKRQGIELRYPRLSTILWLVEELPLRWAAHLCGADARAVIEDGESPHDELLGTFFARAQINTADPQVQPSLVKDWADTLPLRAILQCRGSFPFDRRVDYLFDTSGGRGAAPTFWPASPDRTQFCGYAGGLNPENVATQLAVIAPTAGKYWIDMESGVRDENDRFDLGKCRAVCEAVYGPPA